MAKKATHKNKINPENKMEKEDIPPILSPHLQFLYIENMFMITSSAADSFIEAIKIIEAIEKDDFSNNDSILPHLQNIIIQAASLSKYFYPPSKKPIHQLRSNFLKEVFSIQGENPLLNRSLRNRIEHLDEYIDEHYQDQSLARITQFEYVGPEPSNEVQRDYFRAFYWDTGTFEILGEKLELQPLIDELRRVHDMLVEFHVEKRFPTMDKPEYNIDWYLKPIWDSVPPYNIPMSNTKNG